MNDTTFNIKDISGNVRKTLYRICNADDVVYPVLINRTDSTDSEINLDLRYVHLDDIARFKMEYIYVDTDVKSWNKLSIC